MVYSCICACTAITEFYPRSAGDVAAVEGNELSVCALEYFTWLQSASLEQLTSAKMRLQKAGHVRNSSEGAIQWALLISVPSVSNEQTDREAMKMIARTLKEDINPSNSRTLEYQTLGRIWLLSLQSREQLRANERKRQSEIEKIEGLIKKTQELEQQIEALTSLEQNLIERERLHE